MKAFGNFLLGALALLVALGQAASAQPGPVRDHVPVHGAPSLQSEIFYLLSLIEDDPTVRAAFANEPNLQRIGDTVRIRISTASRACEATMEAVINRQPPPPGMTHCTPASALLTETERHEAELAVGTLFDTHTAIQKLVSAQMRPSGYFQRHSSLDDRALFLTAWSDAQAGISRLIHVYGLGGTLRYPDIDGPIYPVEEFYYRGLLVGLLRDADTRPIAPDMAYGPPLGLGLKLLEANRRDDAIRQRMLQQKENGPTFQRLSQLNWHDFPYTAILAPGHSPEVAYEPLNPNAALRLAKAAELFAKGEAPVIIVSGGAIRPAGTTFVEAIEMKSRLMDQYGIPADAILVDTLARHTTTNLRNTARLLFEAGAPEAGKALVVGDQVPYIFSDTFRERNMEELGYVPYVLHTRRDFDELEFTPVITSLHRDAADPLDP